MGYLTLEEMTSEVSMNLGGVTVDPTRLKRWVNFGYINLGTYVKFEELEKTHPFNVFQGVTSYPRPADFLGVIKIEIRDATTDPDTKYITLQKMKREFHELSDQAQPSHYKLRGTKIIVWPEPDQTYEGYLSYYSTPTRLSASTDLSVFVASWDAAIVMLATHHGLLSLGRQDEADRWLGRFLGYAGSRIDEIDVSADMPQGGINVAWEREDISDLPPDLEG